MISWDVFYKDMVWPHKLSFPIFGFVSRILISKTKISACFAKYMFFECVWRSRTHTAYQAVMPCIKQCNKHSHYPWISDSTNFRFVFPGLLPSTAKQELHPLRPREILLAHCVIRHAVSCWRTRLMQTYNSTAELHMLGSQLWVITVAQSCTCLVASSALSRWRRAAHAW